MTIESSDDSYNKRLSSLRFPILVRYGHIYFPVLFSLALFFTIINYLRAALHDPGVVRRPDTDEVLHVEKANSIHVDKYVSTIDMNE
jgi:hypothetical protein